MISAHLKAWEAGGTYIQVGPLQVKMFVKQLGNPEAAPEKTLMLIHGFPESSYSYHAVVEGLQSQFDRIVLCDFPGFGWSDKPVGSYTYSLFEHTDALLEAWKHFGIQGGHVLAHDMGVSVGTELHYRHQRGLLPAWFSKGLFSLTLTNGSLVIEYAKFRITQKILLSRFGRSFNKLTTFKLFRQQIKSAHGNPNLSDEEVQNLWDMNVLQDGHRIFYLTQLYNLERRRFEKTRWLPALGLSDLPLHVCWGDQDAVARVTMAHHLKEKVCPQATLTIMEGLGHFGQLGSPGKWLEAVGGYYRQEFGLR